MINDESSRVLLRLLHQGEQLYATGELTVTLADPQRYHDFGLAVATDPGLARSALNGARLRFSTITSKLPEQPDEAVVERWLRRVRDEMLET
jgi:hypothetical protein